MYYAINHAYGIRTISARDSLYRFNSRAARDEWVSADPMRGGDYTREACTREEARRRYPAAFRCDVVNPSEWDGDASTPKFWTRGERLTSGALKPWADGAAQAWTGAPTCFG